MSWVKDHKEFCGHVNMLIIPAIDIIQGKVVRLHQGDFNKQKFYSDDPIEIARIWQNKGAKFLHIVDLDGARDGEVKNRDVISGIIKSTDMPCEVGGGLRNEIDIEYFLQQGARRIMLGTKALEEKGYLEKLISKFGDSIAVSIDFIGAHVVKKGWQEETRFSPESVAGSMQKIGVKTLVVTDVARDGTLTGPNIERLEKVLSSVEISVIASGGISSLEDIKKLVGIKGRALEGAIIGRALYEGKIDLEEAIEIAA